ncbi:MarR family transcriptional regulator [Deinococcus sp. KNUC1210]|uniref:MarR family winged helix-turn-helix transcriptional regulator n=1 Tax=Deinococcus sp. KNUC1210 TaxID=2917691 RepID=UPI001EEFDDB6|nr:MarR family transcriptional regulator [Deinococcus sp. KNUC1210]ULH15750.1 MarR family transcriptional regulator [Deinococcus sp. KNUC1210]
MTNPSPSSVPRRAVLSDEEISRFLRGIWRFNQALGQVLKPKLEQQYGIDTKEYYLLHSIARGAVYPKMLADTLHLPFSLVSRHLDTLSKAGLLSRQLDPEDSRRVRLTLTPLGEEVLQGVRDVVHRSASERLRGLDSAGLDLLMQAVDLISGEDDAAPFVTPSAEPLSEVHP